jgi:hypothetical protein
VLLEKDRLVKYRNPVEVEAEEIAPPVPPPTELSALQFVKVESEMLKDTEVPKYNPPIMYGYVYIFLLKKKTSKKKNLLKQLPLSHYKHCF